MAAGRMTVLACCLVGTLLLADIAAAAAAAKGVAGAAAAARRLHQHSGRHSRKLMQPFSLGIQDSGDRTGRANQREIDRLARDSVEFALIPEEVDANSARAGTLASFATTVLFGGQAKSTLDAQTATDQTEAIVRAGNDQRAIGQPGVGIVGVRSGLRAAALNQKLLDSGSDIDKDGDGTDDGPGPKYAVIVAGTVDYSAAGDYTFNGALTDYDYLYDYEYGQPRLIPETAVGTTAVNANTDETDRRAEASGVTRGDASAPAAATRSSSISTGVVGTTEVVSPDDIFGGSYVAPVNPIRKGGSSAAGLAIGRTYKFHQPGTSSSLAGTSATGSADVRAGATGGTFNYASGTKSATTRSQTSTITDVENIGFDVGRK